MSLLGSIFGAGDDQSELDAQLQRDHARDYGPGGRIYNHILATEGKAAADTTYRIVQGHDGLSAEAGNQDQVGKAFAEGLKDGYNNVTGAINTGLAAPFKFAWKALPWQVWAAGLFVGLYYLGGLAWLKRFLRRH